MRVSHVPKIRMHAITSQPRLRNGEDCYQLPSIPRQSRVVVILVKCLFILGLLGCRATAPIHVWTPPESDTLRHSQVALMPIAGDPELAHRLEMEILNQRPLARADVAIFTGDQLAQHSPVRLASTAAVASELTALQAARALGADTLLQGEILIAKINLDEIEEPAGVNMNEAFFQSPSEEPSKDEQLLLSWRIIDCRTSRTLGTHSVSLRTQDAEKRYPDLSFQHADQSARLIAASAREAWKLLSPTVVRSNVRLSVPWLQPGAWRVRRGVAAAKQGNWQTAEKHWKKVAEGIPWNAAAQHNLAVALAAREDFPAAKQRLLKARGPLAVRLPGETLFWLDQQHRQFCAAHDLGKPTEGWSFPEPVPTAATQPVEAVNLEDLPWWTAIPFTKPPT